MKRSRYPDFADKVAGCDSSLLYASAERGPRLWCWMQSVASAAAATNLPKPSALSAVIIFGDRVPGGGFAPAGNARWVGVDAHCRFGELGLMCQDDAAIEPASLADFTREAFGERALGLDIAARVGADKGGAGRDLFGEHGVSRGQQIDMDVVANVSRGAHLGGLAGPPLADQIGAEAGLLERAERVGNNEFAERHIGRLTIKLREIGGHTL